MMLPSARTPSRPLLVVLAALLAVVGPVAAGAQERLPTVTAPKEYFGFEIGADYQVANYEELSGYWARLADESDRMVLDTIGLSEEGRPQLMAILTSPENHQNLERYQEIARRMARARDVEDEEEARRLAEEGKAVVWIDGGLHATELLGAQQLIQLVYDMASRTDEETGRFLDDVIVLAVHANPDGHALVTNWYMRNENPEDRSAAFLPRLYEKYAGHDNNRDFYMAALAETQNMNAVAYREWYPQIIYNHHQTGPDGTVMFAPPFRDPPNHNIHPLMLTNLQQVGSHMHARFVREGKGGTTMRSGASYSTWWNGGLRTTPYFHNMIGLLTETIGSPTPMQIDFIPDRQLTHSDLPLPVDPGRWHFRQSVDYSQTANRAVMDFASRNREHLLLNIWTMGRDAIERGRRDSWDNLPREIYAAEAEIGREGDREDFERLLRRPEDREARGYLLPSDQPDFNTALKFANALLYNGVEVHRATASFTVAGTRYPEGSLVVRTDQAFAPHVFDMFEPQDHPDDFAYPGGPPIPPYDLTGWTLAYQMGVEFDRVIEGFDGPFEPVETAVLEPAPGRVVGSDAGAGFLLDGRVNDAVRVVNRLLADDTEVHRIDAPVRVGSAELPAGTWFVPADAADGDRMADLARETGVDVHALSEPPPGPTTRVRPVRIGLLDEYGGSMSSGWTRMILEDFGFAFERVYAPRLDRGDLSDDFDVLLFPDMDLVSSRGRGGDREVPADVRAEYGDQLGDITETTTIPAIAEFVREGGVAVAWGASAELGPLLGLPLRNALVGPTGRPLDTEEFFIPGSLVAVELEDDPVTAGMEATIDVLFARNEVYEVEPGAEGDVQVLGRFPSTDPLRSGWAWGEDQIAGKPAFFRARMGDGHVFLFTPEITFRAQAHQAFPLVWRALFEGTGGG